MDSFGVMQVSNVAVQNPLPDVNRQDDARCIVHFRGGRLMVSYDGDYRVTITTALGRTLAVYKGNGLTGMALCPKNSGAGIYFAVISTKNGTDIRRFMVN
jgi:hypothetical protein